MFERRRFLWFAFLIAFGVSQFVLLVLLILNGHFPISNRGFIRVKHFPGWEKITIVWSLYLTYNDNYQFNKSWR